MRNTTVVITELQKLVSSDDKITGYKGLTENGHEVYVWSNHPNTLSLSNVSVETVNNWWESMDNTCVIATLKYDDPLDKYNHNTSH